MIILGLKINEKLDWKSYVAKGSNSLIRQLKARIFTLTKVLSFMDNKNEAELYQCNLLRQIFIWNRELGRMR